MAQNRPYRITTQEDRLRIIRAHNEGRDFLRLARELGVSKRTAYNIVRRPEHVPIPRGGARNVKMDNESREFLAEILGENPLITLNLMQQHLREQFPQKPNVCLTTIKNACDGMFYTLKLAINAPADRNSPRIVQERFDYAKWLLREGVQKTLIFIDKMGCNMWSK